MRISSILALVLAFACGMAAQKALERPALSLASTQQNYDLAGIEKLHQLDEHVTLLNDAEALQQEWTADAVRLMPDSAVDIGKRAIFQTDQRFFTAQPDAAIVSYKADIRDVRVVRDWAFEWGLFEAGTRQARSAPVKTSHGKLLRVLHRESNGDWKFARVMADWDNASSK